MSREAGDGDSLPAQRRRIFRHWRWFLCGTYAALVAVLSLAPTKTFDGAPRLFPQQDKAVHALLYAALAWLGNWAASARQSGLRAVWIVAVAATAYGAALEVAQDHLKPFGRHFSWGDVAANAAGAFAAAGLWKCRSRGSA